MKQVGHGERGGVLHRWVWTVPTLYSRCKPANLPTCLPETPRPYQPAQQYRGEARRDQPTQYLMQKGTIVEFHSEATPRSRWPATSGELVDTSSRHRGPGQLARFTLVCGGRPLKIASTTFQHAKCCDSSSHARPIYLDSRGESKT